MQDKFRGRRGKREEHHLYSTCWGDGICVAATATAAAAAAFMSA